MRKLTLFRSLFQIAAFGIFLFQMQGSVKKYLQRPIIQEKSTVSLADIDQPVIYVCKDNKYDYVLSEKTYGYKYIYKLLAGKLKNNSQITWKGQDGNVSFAVLKNILFDNDFEGFSTKHSVTKSVFSLMRGNCKKISWHVGENHNVSEEIYATEKSYMIMVDPMKVDVPSLISMENAKVDFGPVTEEFYLYIGYELIFSLYDSRIQDGITCMDYKSINSSYGKCLDQVMRKEFLKNLDCLPPWISNNTDLVCEKDKAVHIKDKKRYDKLADNLKEMTSGREMDSWKECLPPCMSMSVVMKKTDSISNYIGRSLLDLKAILKVTVYTEVYAYDALSLIVDLGSAMGLWLGLCALTVLDYGIVFCQYVFAKFIK